MMGENTLLNQFKQYVIVIDQSVSSFHIHLFMYLFINSLIDLLYFLQNTLDQNLLKNQS